MLSVFLKLLVLLSFAQVISLNLFSSKLFTSEQEFGDGFNFCVLDIVPEVTTLPNLVAISFVKVEIYFFSISHVTSHCSRDKKVVSF